MQLHYKNELVNAFYGNITVFCENHAKYINKMCGQNTVFLTLKQVLNVANTIPQSIKRGFSDVKQ
jgi:hypothetical protein